MPSVSLQKSTVRTYSVQPAVSRTDEGQHVPHHSSASSDECTNSTCEMCYCALCQTSERAGHHAQAPCTQSCEILQQIFSTSFDFCSFQWVCIISKLCHHTDGLSFLPLRSYFWMDIYTDHERDPSL